MAKRLVASGHRVSMVCGASEPTENGSRNAPVTKTNIEGIDVYSIREPYSNAMSFAKRWFVFLRFAKKALKLIKTFQDVDLIFATSTPLTVGDPGRKAASYHRCPFVFEVRDLWPELPIAMGIVKSWPLKFYLRNMELRAYRAASACVALAPGIKDGIQETGFPSDKIAVIPNSCDLNLFRPAISRDEIEQDERFGRPGDFRLCFCGAHGMANGLDAVLDAVGELKRRGVTGIRFCFIGSGGKKLGLMKRAEEEGLGDFLSWVDPIPKRELARILPQMDVGMQILMNIPAFYRGTSPNKFFDYLSCGLPVLNNYPGWLADYITENDCGLVVEPANPKTFADAVERMKNNRDKIKKMGENGRKLAVETFSRDKLGRQFVEFLEKTAIDSPSHRWPK